MTATLPVSRIDQVLGAFGQAISGALAGIPGGDVFIGWPLPTDVQAAFSKGRYLVSIFPQPASRSRADRARLNLYTQTLPTITLEVAVSGGTLTFSGTAQSGLNIHTLVGAPSQDAYYQTTNADSLETIAIGVASAIDALQIPGMTATANGATVTCSRQIVACNVVGSGTIGSEADRIERRVQVSVWAPTGDSQTNGLLGLRSAVADAIMSSVGTLVNDSIALSDGSSSWCRFVTDATINQSESDMSLYEWHAIYLLEYGIPNNVPGTQVGGFSTTLQVPHSSGVFATG